MLIAKAKTTSGLKLGDMASEMHVAPARLSEWLKGSREPTADQIAYLADKAELPIIETVAAMRPEWAHVWKRASDKIRTLYLTTRFFSPKVERIRVNYPQYC